MARLVSAFLLLDISRSHLASLGVVWIHSQLTLLLTDGTENLFLHIVLLRAIVVGCLELLQPFSTCWTQPTKTDLGCYY